MKKRSTHNLKNLGAQATHRRSNYMAKVALGGTNNVLKAKKIDRTNVAQLREPTNSGSYPKGDCGGTVHQYRDILDAFIADILHQNPKLGWPFHRVGGCNVKTVVVHESVPAELASYIKQHCTVHIATKYN